MIFDVLEYFMFHQHYEALSPKMQKIRMNYEYAFIICKGTIQYLYEFRPRL